MWAVRLAASGFSDSGRGKKEAVALCLDLMWPLQDRLKLRDAKEDLALCFARTGGKQDVKFLNANFSLERQGFTKEDVLAVVPIKHVWQILSQKGASAAGRRPTLARGSGAGAAGSPSTSLRKGVLPGGAGGGAGAGTGAAGGGEEASSLSAWVQRWTVSAQKTSSKEKTHVTLRKMFLFHSKSDKGPPKGVLPVDLYNVERAGPTQLDLLATGDGWQLAKGVVRPQVCLVFDNSAAADKWFDELTKRTGRGASVRQFGVPLWFFEARGEVMPQVFLDCVRYIYGRCLQTKELFRQGGDTDDVKFLRAEYNAGVVPALDKITDPHTIAGLLKTWLSELPEPLLTYDLFSEFMTAMKLSPEQQIKSLQNSIAKIPKINQRVLWILCQLLKLVHDQGAVNFMHSGNLSVIFAPKMIHPKADINITYKTQPVFNQIAEMLIVQNDAIFSTALHSTPPEWSVILDPNRAPLVGARPAATGRQVLSESLAAAAAVPAPVAVAPAPLAAPPQAGPRAGASLRGRLRLCPVLRPPRLRPSRCPACRRTCRRLRLRLPAPRCRLPRRCRRPSTCRRRSICRLRPARPVCRLRRAWARCLLLRRPPLQLSRRLRPRSRRLRLRRSRRLRWRRWRQCRATCRAERCRRACSRAA